MQSNSAATTPACTWTYTDPDSERLSTCLLPSTRDSLCESHHPNPVDPFAEGEALKAAVTAGKSSFTAEGHVFASAISEQGKNISTALGLKAARFKGGVFLDRSTFEKSINFNDAQFGALASFTWTQFKEPAFFYRARFGGEADFDTARFVQDAEFSEAVFMTTADFQWTRFSIAPNFDRTKIVGPARFDGAVFGEHTTFSKTSFGAGSSFARADLTLVKFAGTSLANVELAGAYGVSSAEFEDVRWGTIRRRRRVLGFVAAAVRRVTRRGQARRVSFWLTRRVPVISRITGVIQEERVARRGDNPQSFSEAEHVYRELRRSFEEHRQYGEAHIVQARELEMRRIAKGLTWRRGAARWLRTNLLSLEAAYLILSNYGESPYRPVGWLLLLILIAPIALAAAGLQIGMTKYVLAATPDATTWSAYGDLLGFAIRSGALQNDPADLRLALGSQVVQTLLRVLTPFLAFLFTVAVGRRFKS